MGESYGHGDTIELLKVASDWRLFLVSRAVSVWIRNIAKLRRGKVFPLGYGRCKSREND